MALPKNVVTTNFTVSFAGDAGSSILLAEIDDREGGKNGGNTSFTPGQDAYFLIFKGSNVTLTGIYTSLGGTLYIESSTKQVTETLTFFQPETLTQSLKYPISGGLTSQWIGNTLGNYVLDGNSIRVIPNPQWGAYATGILQVTYTSPCLVYKLYHSPFVAAGVTEYDISVLVVGTVA